MTNYQLIYTFLATGHEVSYLDTRSDQEMLSLGIGQGYLVPTNIHREATMGNICCNSDNCQERGGGLVVQDPIKKSLGKIALKT